MFIYVCVCVRFILFIPSANRYNSLYLLAAMNNAVMNIDICLSLCFQFFWVYTLKGNCWITWRFYVQLFMELPSCFPQWLLFYIPTSNAHVLFCYNALFSCCCCSVPLYMFWILDPYHIYDLQIFLLFCGLFYLSFDGGLRCTKFLISIKSDLSLLLLPAVLVSWPNSMS